MSARAHVRVEEIKRAVGLAVDALTPRPSEELVGFALLDAAAHLYARVGRAAAGERGAATLRSVALETFAELYDLAVREVEHENPTRNLR